MLLTPLHLIFTLSGVVFGARVAPSWPTQLPDEEGPVLLQGGGQILRRVAHSEDSAARNRNTTTAFLQVQSEIARSQFLAGHVIAIPSARLAFCFVPKVASAEFNHMFDKANGISDADRSAAGKAFRNSAPQRFNIPLWNITHRNGWQFGLFLRDPMQRFLSAFGSKCIFTKSGDGDPKYCGGIVGDPSWQSLRRDSSIESKINVFEQHVARFMAELYADGDIKTDNPHYARQLDILQGCGMRRFGPDHADFVGQLSGDVHSQVKTMLRMAGMTNVTPLVTPHFPKAGVAGHSTHLPFNLFFRNETIAAMVRKMYAADYELIENMPRFF